MQDGSLLWEFCCRQTRSSRCASTWTATLSFMAKGRRFKLLGCITYVFALRRTLRGHRGSTGNLGSSRDPTASAKIPIPIKAGLLDGKTSKNEHSIGHTMKLRLGNQCAKEMELGGGPRREKEEKVRPKADSQSSFGMARTDLTSTFSKLRRCSPLLPRRSC
jgi:hypothetical protein